MTVDYFSEGLLTGGSQLCQLLGAKATPQIHEILKTVDDGFKPPASL